MKKITLLFGFMMFFITTSYAQLFTITECLATVDSNLYGPMYSNASANATNRSAALYPSSQLAGIAGQTLNTLYYKRLTATGSMAGTPNFKVYMKEVTATDFGAAALDWATAIATATLVYDSNPAASVGSSAGFKSFPMLTNFVYSGTQNLAVFTEYTNSTASTNIGWAYEYQAPCINTSKNDTGKYSNNTTGVLPVTLTTANYRRPVIGFDFVVSCNAPNTLVVSNVTPSSADIAWTENATQPQDGYEYYLSTSATAPISTTTPTGTTTIGVANVSLSSLPTSTNQYFWVRGNCGAADKSIWVGPLNFATPCIPYSIPYFEGFESGYNNNTTLAGCLIQQSITSTGTWTANNTLTTYNRAPRTGSWNAFLQYGNEDWIFIPIELVGGTSYTVDLYARQDGATSTNANMLISYGTSPSAAGMTNAIVPSTGIINGDYQQITGAFTPAASGTYYVGIKGYISSAPWYISLDDISINVTPACPAPNSLSVSNLTSTSADLTWIGTTGSYEYSFGTIATPPTGAGTATTASTYSASSLTALTTYYFHVRSNCGSAWTTISFTTLATPPSNDNCSGATVLTVNPDYSCAAITSGTVAGATDSGLTNSTCFGTEDDDVWFSFVATSTTHRISILNAAGSVTDMYHVIYDGTGGCAALGASLLCSDNDVSNPTGLVIGNTYYVQVYTYTSTPNQTTTFNVCVGTPPTCYVPTALSAVFVAPTSANLSWTAPTQGNPPAGYNWEIVPQGNAQGVGVVASGNTATTSATATGLTVSTLYDLYVQTNCGGTDLSAWAMTTFITDYCLPSGTSSATYINNFSTTLASTNITNNASGFSPANYGNFTTLSATLGSTQTFNFNVEIIGGTAGCAIWIDWGNDYSFDSTDMVYSTTGYGNGPFTGSVTVPASTPDGNYRMRVMTDWNDSNPGDDNACSFGGGRGEVEDYIITVDNALATQGFDSTSFVAYPNPVKDVLNLSYSTEISSYKVINLLGQEVMSRKVGSTSTQIDMSSLTAGAYIVNVTIGDISKSIKVIKQ